MPGRGWAAGAARVRVMTTGAWSRPKGVSAPLGYRAVPAPPHPTRPQRDHVPGPPSAHKSPGPGSGFPEAKPTAVHGPPGTGRENEPGRPGERRPRYTTRSSGTVPRDRPLPPLPRDRSPRTFLKNRQGEGIFNKRPFGWRAMGFPPEKAVFAGNVKASRN